VYKDNGPPMRYHSIFLILIFSILLSCNVNGNNRTSPIQILYLGDCFFYSSGAVPFLPLKEEPAFRVSAVPTWSLELMRSTRHYMPRTYQDHLVKNDVVFVSDAVVHVFRSEMLQWFARGVIEEGKSFIMVGGLGSFGGGSGIPSWGGSPIEEVLPCNCIDQEIFQGLGAVFPIPVDPEHEFCAPLPWEGCTPFEGFNVVDTKQGAVDILMPGTPYITRGPLLAFWKTGTGTGVAHTPDLTYAWVGAFGDWEYYGDYCANLIYMAAQIMVPQDTNLVHAARTAMQDFSQERALLIAMTEFIDRFGANPKVIEEGISDIIEMKAEADIHYLNQEFVSALEKLGGMRTRARELGEEATELKNAALMWVFIAEWFMVTATLMITGYVLWALMVRRRLYRDIKVTRLGNHSH